MSTPFRVVLVTKPGKLEEFLEQTAISKTVLSMEPPQPVGNPQDMPATNGHQPTSAPNIDMRGRRMTPARRRAVLANLAKAREARHPKEEAPTGLGVSERRSRAQKASALHRQNKFGGLRGRDVVLGTMPKQFTVQDYKAGLLAHGLSDTSSYALLAAHVKDKKAKQIDPSTYERT